MTDGFTGEHYPIKVWLTITLESVNGRKSINSEYQKTKATTMVQETIL